MNKQTFQIPEGCKAVTVGQVGNHIITTFEPVFKRGDVLITKNGRPIYAQENANAKLIAAAPDLLEACINSFKTFHSIGCTMEAEIMQELESAIKKATE